MVNVHYVYTDGAWEAGYEVIEYQWVDAIVSDYGNAGEQTEFNSDLFGRSFQCYQTEGGSGSNWQDRTCYIYMTCNYDGTDCLFNTSDAYNVFFVSGAYTASNGGVDEDYDKMVISQLGISLETMATEEGSAVMGIVSGFALVLSSVIAF